MDTLDALRVFIQVAEAQSFSEAARRGGVSKALASKYVGWLEERLGARLLNRTTRRVSLTEAGAACLLSSRRLLEDYAALVEETAESQRSARGLLRITGPKVFGEDVLAGVVADFMRAHPRIQVDLALEERTVDLIGEGYDLAIRIGRLTDSSLVARRLVDFPYLICAAQDYLERRGTPQEPAELAQHDCIVNSAISPTGQWEFLIGGRLTQVSVPTRARATTARAVATLVRAGIGVGLCLKSTVVDDLESGALVPLLAPFQAYDRSVYAVYPHRAHLPAKVRLFLDHLTTQLSAPSHHSAH